MPAGTLWNQWSNPRLDPGIPHQQKAKSGHQWWAINFSPCQLGVSSKNDTWTVIVSPFHQWLALQVKSQVYLFANDALLYRCIDSVKDQVQLQDVLVTLEKWDNTWGMWFNPQKCYIMRIGRTTKPLTKCYRLMGRALEQVHTYKYLGVTISNKLKWDSHINQNCQKTNWLLVFLRRNLKNCPKALKETAYKLCIPSNLEIRCHYLGPTCTLCEKH